MNRSRKNNIALIGMPGIGKSTVGRCLADKLQRPFIDTDNLIEQRCHSSLQDIVNTKGYLALRAIEAEVIHSLEFKHHVIATGGSVVYNKEAMMHLCDIAWVIYLEADFKTIEHRIHNLTTRGLARKPQQTLHDIFEERRPLYEQFADTRINSKHNDVDAIALQIIKEIPA